MTIYVNYTYDYKLSLLSICGSTGLHVYIAQLGLWSDYEGDLPMIWTKRVMTKVVIM